MPVPYEPAFLDHRNILQTNNLRKKMKFIVISEKNHIKVDIYS